MTSPQSDAQQSRSYMGALIDREDDQRARIGRVAAIAGAVAATCVVLIAVSLVLIQTGGGLSLVIVRAVLIAVTGIGAMAMLTATGATIAWLRRSRQASLATLDARLAAIEARLAELEPRHR